MQLASKFGWALVLGALGATGCGAGDETSPAPPVDVDPIDEPPVEPGPWEARFDWRSRGLGEVFSFASADFKGDGQEQLAIGGRRPALLSGDGNTLLWRTDWNTAAHENPRRGADIMEEAQSLNAVPREGGGFDLLLTNANKEAMLVDGRDGTIRWERKVHAEFQTLAATTLFGDPAAPLFFTTVGYAAYRASTGELAWESPVPLWPGHVRAARMGPGEPTGIWLAVEFGSTAGAGGVDPDAPTQPFPSVHLVDAQGQLIAERTFEAELQLTAAGVADLDGQGHDSIVVGLEHGRLAAVGPDGALRWEKTLSLYGGPNSPARTLVTKVFGRDVTGDGRDEVFVTVLDRNRERWHDVPSQVLAFSPDGDLLWQQPFGFLTWDVRLASLDGDPVLLLGAAPYDYTVYGQVMAVRLADGLEANQRVAFRTQVPFHVNQLGVLEGPHGSEVVVGSVDGVVRSLDATGAPKWAYHVGTWVLDLAAVEQGGHSVGVFAGEAFGHVTFTDASGTRRWHRALDTGKYGHTAAVAAADLDGDGEASLVATGSALAETGLGVVGAWTQAGQQRFSLRLGGIPLALATGDLDGDGAAEILVVEGRRLDEPCYLLVLDGDGIVRSERPLERCGGASISVADVDGDGRAEIAVHLPPSGQGEASYLLFLEADGVVRWSVDELAEGSTWLQLGPNGLVHGGIALANRGFVAVRDLETGERRWMTPLASQPDLLYPERVPAHGAAFAHVVVPDLDGDDVDEIAVVNLANDLYLLDGATGTAHWVTSLESTELPDTHRHYGAHLAFVPAADGLPAHLVAAQAFEPNVRAEAFFYSLEGERLGALPLDACADAAVTLHPEGGRPTVVIAAGLALYATSGHPLPQETE